MTWRPETSQTSFPAFEPASLSPHTAFAPPQPFQGLAHSTPAPGMTNSFSSSGPQLIVTSSENTSLITPLHSTHSLASVTIASAHLFPSEPFSQSEGPCFVYCALAWPLSVLFGGMCSSARLEPLTWPSSRQCLQRMTPVNAQQIVLNG